MPQLDIFTFFPQIFWGFFFFFLQFFFISYSFLPLLASSLKFKQKYLAFVFEKEIPSFSQKNKLETSTNILFLPIKEIDTNLHNIFLSSQSFDVLSKKNFLTKTFLNINQQLIKTPFFLCIVSRSYFLFVKH